jgi:hypothetical protein
MDYLIQGQLSGVDTVQIAPPLVRTQTSPDSVTVTMFQGGS